jgi:hypothetical protein
MNHEIFKKDVLNQLFSLELEIGETKAQEYSSAEDRLSNFKRLGKQLDLDPKKILWVYLTKHLDSILRYINSGEVLSESIEGRILDCRVYLSLLLGLIKEQEGVGVDVNG